MHDMVPTEFISVGACVEIWGAEYFGVHVMTGSAGVALEVALAPEVFVGTNVIVPGVAAETWATREMLAELVCDACAELVATNPLNPRIRMPRIVVIFPHRLI